jgi:hypothetical protein
MEYCYATGNISVTGNSKTIHVGGITPLVGNLTRSVALQSALSASGPGLKYVGRVWAETGPQSKPNYNYALSGMTVTLKGGNNSNPYEPTLGNRVYPTSQGLANPYGGNTGTLTWATAFKDAPWGKTGAADPGWKGTAANYGSGGVITASNLPVLWFESGGTAVHVAPVVSTGSTTGSGSTGIDDEALISALGSLGLTMEPAIAPTTDLTITLVDGKSVKLSSYRGKPLIIGIGLMPDGRSPADFKKLDALWKAYKDAGLQVLCAVFPDAATTSNFMKSNGLTMPFCTNWQELKSCYSKQTSIITPLYFIVDSKGNCILKYEDLMDWSAIKKYLDNR